ncbi:autotransporter domain-containing protein [Pontiella sulfatireligans]|uniref:Autotransporter domain-containing protein n=1 Tax=Pontiella sulfatireligans TaxID=2750658 RepID=A0A6C2UMX0_9BACT|nr:autotransporter domain-containing protein [Pontiella sulfatireligans]VGO21369.1 hypothetical protein SCARR_03441 [Pontiella sulfatireligans]
MNFWGIAILSCLLCAMPYYGICASEPIDDGQDLTVSGGTWDLGNDDLWVGGTTPDNFLAIIAGGSVSDSSGYIGRSSGANNNAVFVSGQASVWSNRNDVMIGAGGSGNLLWVEDGAQVQSKNLLVGDSVGAVSNKLVASGSGSMLKVLEVPPSTTGGGSVVTVASGYLFVGREGSGNSLETLEGAVVDDSYGVIGGSSSASNNAVRVSGSGSRWRNSKGLYLGGLKLPAFLPLDPGERWIDGGTGNSLTVEDGGLVLVGDAGTNEIPSTGSVGTIAVGNYSGTAEMVVANGSRVESGLGVVGFDTGNSGSVVVTGEGSVWTNSGLLVGEGVGSRVSVLDGGRIDSDIGWVGLADGAANNSVVVSGTGSLWNVAQEWAVGYAGTSNSLLVADGGRVVNSGYGIIGNASSAHGNSVVVDGAGSVLHNAQGLSIGDFGSGNSLVISDGGVVESRAGFIGDQAGANGNSVLVSGNGSLWNCDIFHIGDFDFLPASAQVASLDYYEPGTPAGGIYVDPVTGPILIRSMNLYVGNEGSSNTLVVSDRGEVQSRSGYVGYADTSHGNAVVVSGEGSAWVNDTGLYVGFEGAGNSLRIEDGARVDSSFVAYLGHSEGAFGNSAFIDGVGSVWSNSGSMFVGGEGSGNSLSILNGGRLESYGGYVGGGEASAGNTVIVSGEGALWNANDFYPVSTNLCYGGVCSTVGPVGLNVGYEGTGNSLLIADGGLVESTLGYIGHKETASGNSVLVSGEESMWDNSASLYVGYDGSGNELAIVDGGRVESSGGFIGYAAPASGNSAVVSGEGSMWDSSSQLHVGYNGSGNTLRIEDGGHAHTRWGSSIGFGEGADNNSVVVSGENSVLSSGWYSKRIIAVPPDIGIPWRTNFPPIVITPPIGWPPVITNPPPFVTPYPTNLVPVIPGGGSITGSGSLVIGNNPSGSVLILTNGASFVGGEGLYLNPNNQLVISNGGFVGGSGGTLTVSTNQLSLGSATGGSGLWIGSTNSLVIQDGIFTGGAGGIVATNAPISITNRPPPIQVEPIMAMASWGELSVGRGGSGNTLLVEDGAQVFSMTGIIGETATAWSNTVSVIGTNSQWRNSGDLYIGGRMSQYYYMTSDGWQNEWVDGGQGNSLYVGDGGLVSVGRDMHNRNHSLVDIEIGGHVSVASNYYQDATSILRFGVETNAAGAPLNALVSVGGTAEFEEGATLQYHSNVGVLDFDVFYTNLIVEANQLIVAGVTNADAIDLEAVNLDGSLVDVLLWENEQDIYGLVGRKYLADSAGFAPGSEMARLSKEIDDISMLGDAGAAAQINLLNGMSSEQQSKQLTQRYDQGAPTYMHAQAMFGGQKQVLAQSRGALASVATPEGAAGPHKAEQGLRGWMRGYGAWADRDGSGSFSGYDQNVYGTVVGFDKSYGGILVGAAGGYAHSDIDQNNHDGSDAETGYGILYSSFGTANWFGDLNFSYGHSRVKTHSGTAFKAKAKFDADSYAAYIGGGREIKFAGDGVLFTPEMSLSVGWYDQESYTEKSDYVARKVDSYDRWSVQSRLGASLAVQRMVGSVLLKPEVRAFWLREFKDDPEKVGYSLAGGTGGNYTFGMQAPDDNVFELGAGISTLLDEQVEIVLDVDSQFSDRYKAVTVSARVMYEF